MTIVIQNPAAAVNYSLAKIGYKLRVGSLFDGSLAAKKALDTYGQVRDNLIMQSDWDFVERQIAGTLLKQAPASYITNPWTTAYPQIPWQFEYAYPDDAVKIRGIRPQPVAIPNFDPRFYRFDVSNDSAIPAKVVLCNVQNAIIVYAGQVTDLTQWDETALETFTDALGKALGPVLTDLNAVRLAAAEQAADQAASDTSEG